MAILYPMAMVGSALFTPQLVSNAVATTIGNVTSVTTSKYYCICTVVLDVSPIRLCAVLSFTNNYRTEDAKLMHERNVVALYK